MLTAVCFLVCRREFGLFAAVLTVRGDSGGGVGMQVPWSGRGTLLVRAPSLHRAFPSTSLTADLASAPAASIGVPWSRDAPRFARCGRSGVDCPRLRSTSRTTATRETG
ncbi:hypothetical protein AAFF_G00275940 [Aldrovandia affinis]|uniref:Secreted protein n=1 Tax=Aldrovandia affinis TaxID=143900 RepID=A0AAD7W275_9TELE|nr:hypothetical protein AAFF_G00275940 [Aldrovandia affinis]